MPYLNHRSQVEILLALYHLHHLAVEVAKPMIAQFLIINEVPLTASVFIAPSVTLTREVYPFWMPPFVAHEVEVAAIDSRSRYKAYHLMKGDTTCGNIILVTLLKVPVHIGINKTEHNGLVAYKCLIMRLCVRYRLFILTAIGEFPENIKYAPILISFLLDHLDPVVRDTHSQTIVEAHTAISKLCCKSRHTRHLLSNGNSILIHLMDEFI